MLTNNVTHVRLLLEGSDLYEQLLVLNNKLWMTERPTSV